jgi:hypothetical protein
MKETWVQDKITDKLPNMKVYDVPKDILVKAPLTVLTTKGDGEAEFLVYNRQGFADTADKAYTLNKWGRKRTDYPALNEFIQSMSEVPSIESCEMMAEAYAMEGDNALMLPQFIHYIKSQDPELLGKVHLGIWNLMKMNGHVVVNDYLWRCEEVNSWLANGKLTRMMPFLVPKSPMEVQLFWDYYVVKKHYEGLVIWYNDHGQDEVFKCKPFKEIDVVILGINKKSGYGKGNLFAQHQVTSLHVGLMRPDGKFVEIGDCASGIDHQLRSALWKVKEKFAIEEDDKIVWIQPRIVAQVGYIDLFKGKNKVYSYDGTKYREVETMPLIRMKSPQLIHFRPDKTVTPENLRIEQIPQDYLIEETPEVRT